MFVEESDRGPGGRLPAPGARRYGGPWSRRSLRHLYQAAAAESAICRQYHRQGAGRLCVRRGRLDELQLRGYYWEPGAPGTGSAERMSDLSLTNSLATSSLVR